MRKRKVFSGEVHHICQMTQGKVVIFYSLADYLVYFTVFCTYAEKMEVQVLALCLMPDHLHHAVIVRDARQLADFEKLCTRSFAVLWNKSRKRKGVLFKHNYQSAAKLGAKQVRTTLAYNYNNPVERSIVRLAEEYRWNFLMYARASRPFSKPATPVRTALRTARQEARATRERGDSLNYAQLDRMMSKLNRDERNELADYIIGLWNIIDYEKAISYYGDHASMIRAFHDNTGGEYEIREDRDPYSDAVYADCTHILLRDRLIGCVYEIPTLPMEKKMELYRILRRRTSARPRQLRKYLHIPTNEVPGDSPIS